MADPRREVVRPLRRGHPGRRWDDAAAGVPPARRPVPLDLRVPPSGRGANWHQFLRRYPPLDRLLKGAAQADLGQSLIGERFEIEGIPIDVVELTGGPGDVIVTHLHVFHCASPNTSDTPRQMLGKAVLAG